MFLLQQCLRKRVLHICLEQRAIQRSWNELRIIGEAQVILAISQEYDKGGLWLDIEWKWKLRGLEKNWTKWVRSSVEVLVFAFSLSEVECRGLKNSVKLGLFEESSSETSSEVEFLTLFLSKKNVFSIRLFFDTLFFRQNLHSGNHWFHNVFRRVLTIQTRSNKNSFKKSPI